MIILIIIALFVLAALGGLFLYDRYIKCPKCGSYTMTKVTDCSPNNFNRRPSSIVTASSGTDEKGNRLPEDIPYNLSVNKREYNCKCGHKQIVY